MCGSRGGHTLLARRYDQAKPPSAPRSFIMSISDHAVPIPEPWRFPLLTLGAMIALAGLDFVGAIFAKEWADGGHLVLMAGGSASFSALFVVYARILKVAELSVVTLG